MRDAVAVLLIAFVGVVSTLACLVQVSRLRRAERGEPAALDELAETLLPQQPDPDGCPDGGVEQAPDTPVDGLAIPDYLPDGWTADTPPLVVDGPPGMGHGVIPSGLPIVRRPACSRCRDEGFLGGCSWCSAVPLMASELGSLLGEWQRSGDAADRDGWRNL